jgi:hypothetical protein
MPKSYIGSKPPPNQLVDDWLKWTRLDFERKLLGSSKRLLPLWASIRPGIFSAYSCPQTIIPRAFALENALAVIGNNYNSHSKPSFIFTDTTTIVSPQKYTGNSHFHPRCCRICPGHQPLYLLTWLLFRLSFLFSLVSN